MLRHIIILVSDMFLFVYLVCFFMFRPVHRCLLYLSQSPLKRVSQAEITMSIDYL